MKVWFFSLMILITLAAPALAQTDERGCSTKGVDLINDPLSLEASLWTYRSTAWDGYIDFQQDGIFSTHWGTGTWKVTPEGSIHMENNYNAYTYEVYLGNNGTTLTGVRNDGFQIAGNLICAQYHGDGAKVSYEVEDFFRRSFSLVLARPPKSRELMMMGKQYNNGVSMKELRDSLYQSGEYLAAHPQPTPTPPATEEQLGY